MSAKARAWVVGVVAVTVVGIPLLVKQTRGNPAGEPHAGSSAVALGRVPTFIDIGTTTCAPCKMMLRVMGELEAQYPGKLRIEFVNIKDDPDALASYGISVIPAQIFKSPDGRELFRHKGFFSTKDVVAKWKELGYDLGAPARVAGAR
jgi:thioredoxin 1